MPNDETQFPETIEIAGYNKDLLTEMARTYPRAAWTEIAEYKLVKVRRVRWNPETEDL